MIRVLLILLCLVPQLVGAKPPTCGMREVFDDGGPIFASPVPETPWRGVYGAKRLRCCVLDLRWLDWAHAGPAEAPYSFVPAALEARCVLGRHRRVTLRVLREGGGSFFPSRFSRRWCSVEVPGASAGPIQGWVVCPKRVTGLALASVGGAFVW